MRLASIFLSFVLIASWPPSWIHGQEVTLIRSVNLISMQDESSPIADKMDVLIVGDQFNTIGISGSIDIPKQATIIEGLGLFLIPGLADAHVHFNFAASNDTKPSQFVREDNEILRRLFIAHGVTFVRSMWGSPEIVELRDRCNSGKLLGPTIFTTGPLLSGSSIDPVRNLQSDQDVDDILAEHDRLQYDALKIHSNPSEPALRLLIREAGKREIPVFGHIPFSVNATEILSFPEFTTIEHLNAIVGACVQDDSTALQEGWPNLMKMFTEQDPVKQRQWARLAKKSDKWFCPTLMTSRIDALSPDEFKKTLDQFSAQYVTDKTINFWRNSLSYEKQMYVKSGVQLSSFYQAPCDIMSAFIAADVRIIAGTDTPVRPGVAGQVLHSELAEFVRLGMSPWQALRTATRNVAEAVEQEERFGQIKKGMRADAVLLRANPLESIENLKAIEIVIHRGKALDRKKLDSLLLEVGGLIKQANIAK